MSKGRHRAEPVRQTSARLPRQLTRPAAGIGAALLASALVVSLWPDARSTVGDTAVIVADDLRQDDAVAANALRAAAAMRTEERVSRRRSAPAQPASSAVTSASPTPAATTPASSVPEMVGQRWATTGVTIRSGPSAERDRIGALEAAAGIGITGVTENGWTQVVTDGRVGWVKSTYLATSKPKVASVPSGVSDAKCSISTSIESHLTSRARAVYRAVCAAYGDSVSSFGGYRAGDDGDHGNGKAIDIMVSGEPGWVIARYVQAHARELGVSYVIYRQQIWMAGNPTSQWKFMEDRGGTTANHYDHVHVSVS
ncbi:MAG: SH3 domain-containing protein [Kineosporiaceae bacterium]|nr:SH3 domain-containing protein [Kineosporiaceae bacterium]MBK7622101.1 SH3 domain-containing protein [Kineosporiaceae bacterium]